MENYSLPNCNVCSASGPPDPVYLKYNLVLIGFMMPTVGALGLIGNSLSAFVYSRPRMRSSTNLYLCALGFSDIFVIITALFLFFVEGMRRYGPTISYWYARGAPYFYPSGMTAQTCSVYFTVAAAVDCFVMVVLPQVCKKVVCTPRTAKAVIFSVLIFGVLYNISHCFEIDIIDCIEVEWNVTSLQVCPTMFRMDELYYEIYYAYLYTIVMAAGPLVLLIVLNTSIVSSMLLRRRQQTEDDGSGDTITLILVVFLFIFCNSLALIINFLEQTLAEKLGGTMNYLVDVSNLLVVCNSSANFVIYYAFGESFRTTLRIYLCQMPQSNNRNKRGQNGLAQPEVQLDHLNCGLHHPALDSFSSQDESGAALLDNHQVTLVENTKAEEV